MKKEAIYTSQAPRPRGKYSQAIKSDNIIFLSGQLPIDPTTSEIVEGDVKDHFTQCLKNLQAVCQESGGTLDNIVKLNVYLTDLSEAHEIDLVMEEFFNEPYPARIRLGISDLSFNSLVEIDGIMVIWFENLWNFWELSVNTLS